MAEPKKRWTDENVELIIGNLLRAGVVLAATVVLIGGIFYLSAHGGQRADNHEFRGEELRFRSPPAIVQAAVEGRSSRAIIQLGLLILIATPVARVVFSVFAFGRERDFTYVGITVIVLIVLLYSLFNTHLGGH
jgi:uncharacterized membrane protein